MIRQGKDTDKETLMQLWKWCFPRDSEDFVRFYFDKVYANEETLVYVEDEQPVASLQMIPFQIKTGENIFLGGYISGAMTHPDYRKKEYMSQLMNASFDEMQKKGYDYTFLIPQEKWLIQMYEKFGFHLCEPSFYPPENKLLKTLRQFENIQQVYFNENGVWIKEEPVLPVEHKGMIKRLNPAAQEITTLYMGMMLD